MLSCMALRWSGYNPKWISQDVPDNGSVWVYVCVCLYVCVRMCCVRCMCIFKKTLRLNYHVSLPSVFFPKWDEERDGGKFPLLLNQELFLFQKQKINRWDKQSWQEKEKCLKIKKIFLTDTAPQITKSVSTTTQDKTKKKVNNYASLRFLMKWGE